MTRPHATRAMRAAPFRSPIARVGDPRQAPHSAPAIASRISGWSVVNSRASSTNRTTALIVVDVNALGQLASLARAPRRQTTSLLIVLLSAAALRFWALDHGIPFSVGVDEPEIMERAVRMIKTGDFHPHFFDYPGLYIYLQAAVAALRFIWGALHGAWTSLDGASTADFYLWARAVTAALGVATVGIVFACGLRWGYPQAVLASLFVAV